jgi:hypothetical protein
MSATARMLVIAGLILVLAGVMWDVFGRAPFWGRLPGDILIRKKNFTFYFPLATSLLLSAVLSLVLWFFSRRSG